MNELTIADVDLILKQAEGIDNIEDSEEKERKKNKEPMTRGIIDKVIGGAGVVAGSVANGVASANKIYTSRGPVNIIPE